MSTIERLQTWFLKHCDGDWEHGNTIEITTLDNPGWKIKVNLFDTPLERKPFDPIRRDGDKNWISCRVENSSFNGWGGPANLEELVQIFLTWAEANSDSSVG